MILQGIKKIAPVIIALTLIMLPVLAAAAEVKFPVPAYTQDELAKVREWEKTWAGKKIDKTNVDQVAEFMPESYVGIYKNPDKWGGPPEGISFHIVPYKQIIETKGMIEATKKYAPLVETDAEGKITNYSEIAGFPFPEPKTGLEIAYNNECQSRGDTQTYRFYGPVIDPKSRTDRWADQEFTMMYFIHRVELDPKPAILKNPKGYHRGQFMHITQPHENNNSRLISMKYIDETKEYDSYIFFAQFRRIQRLSVAERTNAIDGTDMIYDDGEMWDGYLSRNTYEYKGKKDLLLGRHLSNEKLTRKPGQAVPSGYALERCNTYVVDVKSRDPDYIYSKRVWYIDPETYWIHWQEVYDELGRLWKIFFQPTDDIKTAKGNMKNFITVNNFHDIQRTHSNYTQIITKAISHKVKPKIFLLSNLQRTY
jgi:hypothetical protein